MAAARALEADATDDAPAGTDRTITADVKSRLRARSRSLPGRPPGDSRCESWPHVLNPDRLSDYIDRLYRAAWALCGSRHDAEDLVQETLVNVLKRLGCSATTTRSAT